MDLFLGQDTFLRNVSSCFQIYNDVIVLFYSFVIFKNYLMEI